MKVLAIIQARLDSQRLPGKVLMQIPPESGVSMLEMIIRKVMLAKLVDDICIVTPDEKIAKIIDILIPQIVCYIKSFTFRDVVKEFFEPIHYSYSRYSNDKGRVEEFRKNLILVRITADCPLIKPEEIDHCIKMYQSSDADLVYNTDESTGQLNGEGSDVEVFSYEALKRTYKSILTQDEREHPTLWMRRNLKTLFVPCKKLGILSVNTEEDYKKVCEIVKNS